MGYFIDAPVQGLYYTTSSGVSGYTGSDGSFSYNVGDSVTFKIGQVIIGSANATISNIIINPASLYGVSLSQLQNCINSISSCNINDYPAILTSQLIQTYGSCTNASSTICSVTSSPNLPSMNISTINSYSSYSSFTSQYNLISASVATNNLIKNASGFTLNIYSGTDYQNEPVVMVYINNQPVKLLLDTGASGLVVNQSAIGNAIPRSAYTNQTFFSSYGDGSTISGTMASATVCINPSLAQSCITMPIGVITSGNAYPTNGEIQGDFGMDNALNTQGTSNAYSYNYYLLQQNQYLNAFEIQWYSLSNGYWQGSSTNPIGQIVFDNANNSAPSYIFSYNGSFPETSMSFKSYTDMGLFDTGSNYDFISTSVLQAEIPNYSTSKDENNCNSPAWVNGGYIISYSINSFNSSITTEPQSQSMCNYISAGSLFEGLVMDNGQSAVGAEDIGLPDMLEHTFYWYLDANRGFVYQLGIK